jgi:hypothetical protein
MPDVEAYQASLSDLAHDAPNERITAVHKTTRKIVTARWARQRPSVQTHLQLQSRSSCIELRKGRECRARTCTQALVLLVPRDSSLMVASVTRLSLLPPPTLALPLVSALTGAAAPPALSNLQPNSAAHKGRSQKACMSARHRKSMQGPFRALMRWPTEGFLTGRVPKAQSNSSREGCWPILNTAPR